MAEEFMYQSKHVLIVYDDLSKQAVTIVNCRSCFVVSPGLKPSPRIFSISTAVCWALIKFRWTWWWINYSPTIYRDTSRNISAYITTNVISITDGQIFLGDGLFNGIRPAIDAGSSVSRVGGSAQIKAPVAGTLRIDLASYRELKPLLKFGHDLDAATELSWTVDVVPLSLETTCCKPLPVENK